MGSDGFALKGYLRPVAKRLEPHLQYLGTTLLRRRLTRETLNLAYEGWGRAFAAAACRAFSGSVVPTAFVWSVGFADAEFRVPVTPRKPESWSNALYWRWAAAQPMRHNYEWYLKSHSVRSANAPVYLDIGANDGMYTYPFASRGWTCVAFEPQESCVSYMRETCRLNGFQDITIERTAVGDRTAPAVEFFVSKSGWYSSLNRANVERFEAAERVAVPLVTIDDYCGENRLRPRCLKIDVEGAELAVLRGAMATLTSALPDLFIEVGANEQAKQELWRMLRDLGYDFRAIGFGDEHLGRPACSLSEFLSIGNERNHCDYMLLSARQGATAQAHRPSNPVL